jgi:hypothetical protein
VDPLFKELRIHQTESSTIPTGRAPIVLLNDLDWSAQEQRFGQLGNGRVGDPDATVRNRSTDTLCGCAVDSEATVIELFRDLRIFGKAVESK